MSQDGRGQGKVDVFQVHQFDPVRIVRRERNWVHSADGKVARIKAPGHLRSGKDLPYMLGSFDQGPDVGMEHLAQAVPGTHPVDHGQLVGDLVPLASVQVKGWGPRHVDHDSGDEVRPPGAPQQSRSPFSVLLRPSPLSLVVECQGHEATHRAQGVLR